MFAVLALMAGALRPLLGGPSLIREAMEERRLILDALERNRWNRERTAAEIGISRVSLWRKMRALQMEPGVPEPPRRFTHRTPQDESLVPPVITGCFGLRFLQEGS